MDTTSPLALIFTGGSSPTADVVATVPTPQLVIAADSGWTHARTHGFTPHYLVGDFDSITPHELDEATQLGVDIVQHPTDKDVTDTELALSLARGMHYERIHVLSGGGDRFDHLMAMMHSLVAHTEEATITAHVGTSHIHFVTPKQRFTMACEPHTTVSLIPLGGSARGVRTTGLRWNLQRDTLASFSSRGVSNYTCDTSYSVSVRTGVLALITTPTDSTLTNGDMS
jgi:thiamine pyrophosphokinase